jgi:hypothetical protein
MSVKRKTDALCRFEIGKGGTDFCSLPAAIYETFNTNAALLARQLCALFISFASLVSILEAASV